MNKGLITKIRKQLAIIFNKPENYNYFSADYEEGETADEAITRLFLEEQECQENKTDEQIIDILAFG